MISIIIPVYNAEKTLERCLDSVLQQDFHDIEVIAVNDGSKDKSKEILDRYQNCDRRLHVIHQENGGVSVARNKGINYAHGEYIMFVDSDDFLELNACTRAMECMDKKCEMLIFGLNIFKDGSLLRTPHLSSQSFLLKENINFYWTLRKINLGPCNKVYRKDLILKLFDSSLSLGEDTLFVIEYMKNINTIKNIDDCLYNVTLDNTNSLNRKYRSDRLDQLIFVRKKELDALSEIYANNINSRIYEEFFLDLHVVLTGLYYNNIDSKLEKIKENILKYNYPSIVSKTNFSSVYYKIFANLASQKQYLLLYILLFVRIFVEKLLVKK